MTIPAFPFPGVTPITITMTDGIDESGAPAVVGTYSGNCHFFEMTRTRRGKDDIEVTISGKAIILVDIAPNLERISGHVAIGARSYKIFQVKRHRDMTGAVHHTEVELI